MITSFWSCVINDVFFTRKQKKRDYAPDNIFLNLIKENQWGQPMALKKSTISITGYTMPFYLNQNRAVLHPGSPCLK